MIAWVADAMTITRGLTYGPSKKKWLRSTALQQSASCFDQSRPGRTTGCVALHAGGQSP